MLVTDFCIKAVQEAIHHYGTPDIFNIDQGSQFTSLEFMQLLKDHGIAISMDGKGCWRGKERHRTLSGALQRTAAAQQLDGSTPDTFYFAHLPALEQAA